MERETGKRRRDGNEEQDGTRDRDENGEVVQMTSKGGGRWIGVGGRCGWGKVRGQYGFGAKDMVGGLDGDALSPLFLD